MSVYPTGAVIKREADLSDDGLYRYRLTRRWGPHAMLPFVMLNPSTADAEQDDPTIRRCVSFAQAHGHHGIGVWNLYAFRATKPADCFRAADPVGPENDHRLRELLQAAASADIPVVAAWGANARQDRVDEVLSWPYAGQFHHLGLTNKGIPRHPLMLSGDARLTPWVRG